MLQKTKTWQFLLLTILVSFSCQSQQFKTTPDMTTPFEKNTNYSASYDEAIAYYKKLADRFSEITISEFGMTDIGKPLHVVVISDIGIATATEIDRKNKTVLLINNAIHPGEPCGVDASMMLARDLVSQPSSKEFLNKTIVVIIPFYNIGGALNRSSTSRVNQAGPEQYGFRGNAQNLDLNRDFIKCDSKNAASFNQIFTQWNPDIFIDNHTSNGADYQYTMTLIATQKDKLATPLSGFLSEQLLPELYRKMKVKNWEMCPYVYAQTTPDKGIAAFLDLARYSSGYAALNHTISFMPETHMLKPYEDRVESTYAFMESMLEFLSNNGTQLKEARAKAIQLSKEKETFDIQWEMENDKVDSITFKGYEAKYKPSEVSGLERLYYDRNAPFEKKIPFFTHYKPSLSIKKPTAYIIPQAYHKIIERMQWNGVVVEQLTADEMMDVEIYSIQDYKTTKDAYEGHYMHSDVTVKKSKRKQQYRAGDFIIKTNQAKNRYIIETLEPQAPDSWFAWNFFDGILMQKEYFSAYVFEDLAAEILKNDKALAERLAAKRKSDEAFAKSTQAQLDFVYKNSEHFEWTYQLYPVGRVVDK